MLACVHNWRFQATECAQAHAPLTWHGTAPACLFGARGETGITDESVAMSSGEMALDGLLCVLKGEGVPTAFRFES